MPFQKGVPRPENAGRRKGSVNKRTVEAQEFAAKLLTNREYQRNLRRRLKDGELAPQLEALLYYYYYGKPADQLQISGTLTLSRVLEDARPRLRAMSTEQLQHVVTVLGELTGQEVEAPRVLEGEVTPDDQPDE